MDRHARLIILEALHRPAETHADVRPAARVFEQELLDIQLVRAQQRLRHLPGRGRFRHGALLLGLGRHAEPRQLVAVEPREIADIRRPVGRQAKCADLPRDAKPAVMLHGAGIVRRTLGVRADFRLGVEQHRSHAVAVKKQREQQAHRAAADDGDRRILHIVGIH